MVCYETLILAAPEITQDETSKLEKQFAEHVKKAQGTLTSYDRWGKYRLAYPIRHNDYGVYFLTRYEIDPANVAEFINELRKLFIYKFENIVMRQMTTRLEGDDLSYTKPDSLEEIPSGDVDSFLRENKMEGLLSSTSKEKEEKKAVSEVKPTETVEEKVVVEQVIELEAEPKE